MDALGEDRELLVTIAEERGLEWTALRVRHLKDVFFSKGNRPALFFPTGTRHAVQPDDLYFGREKFLMSFDLPKGAYATLVVKRCTRLGDPSAGDSDIDSEADAEDDPDTP